MPFTLGRSAALAAEAQTIRRTLTGSVDVDIGRFLFSIFLKLLREAIAAGGKVLLDGETGAKDGVLGDFATGKDDDLDAKRCPGANTAAELLEARVDPFPLNDDLDGLFVQAVVRGPNLRA
jgi:hypothetical protein